MQIVNYTPHMINIVGNVTFSDKDRKYLTNEETIIIKSIPPSGMLLNAKQVNEDTEAIDGIPTKVMTFSGVTEAPKDRYCIVSAMYVTACKQLGIDTYNLLTIGDAVYSADTIKPIGTLNLNRN